MYPYDRIRSFYITKNVTILFVYGNNLILDDNDYIFDDLFICRPVFFNEISIITWLMING